MSSSNRRESIILLTRDFPFRGGEGFVRDEVSRLARFGRVIVLPAFYFLWRFQLGRNADRLKVRAKEAMS